MTMNIPPLARNLIQDLERKADPEQAVFLQRFFKTGPGQYGHGDLFLGIKVPLVRTLVKPYRGLALEEVKKLLLSPCHEVRLAGLILLVDAMQSPGTDGAKPAVLRRDVFNTYLWAMERERVNNWDLVDISASHVVGRYLHEHAPEETALLHDWAESPRLWTRRIAIVATFHFIRQGHLETTLDIARKLLHDPEDLIHKAVGWMLREVGKRDLAVLEAFLAAHCRIMPRTMLRYAVERLPSDRRKMYLQGTPGPRPAGGNASHAPRSGKA